MDNTKSLRFIIPVVIAFSLIVFGVFQLYKSRVKNQTDDMSPNPSASLTTGFEVSPTPSTLPIVLGTTPNAQPDSGSDTIEIKNVGIYVNEPLLNQTITSPIKVSGHANVFDGNVQIRVKDSNGTVLGKGSAKACLGVDSCPFETRVAFSKSSTSTGTVELYSPNAVDGAEDYFQAIPIIFQ